VTQPTGAAAEFLRALAPGGGRLARSLAVLLLVTSSAGCILTKDLPDPALDVPDGYKAARLTSDETTLLSDVSSQIAKAVVSQAGLK